MKDLMVDIETLGTSHNTVITQIGACFFDRTTGEIGEKFLVNIRVQDCLDKGMIVSGDTLKFWFEQKERSWLSNAVNLSKALEDFRGFVKGCECVWSHATFDIPILANAYNVIGTKMPFHYRAARDIRTLVDLSGLEKPKTTEEKTHNALEDCIYQVEYCCRAFKNLTEKKQ